MAESPPKSDQPFPPSSPRSSPKSNSDSSPRKSDSSPGNSDSSSRKHQKSKSSSRKSDPWFFGGGFGVYAYGVRPTVVCVKGGFCLDFCAGFGLSKTAYVLEIDLYLRKMPWL
ncbi:hypothetical protein L195_g046141 [Trifolium pratense]|uniref:Uncharacterized protein n=1 Tax=Trifolium pratense TaxID=57577 RepID=A0A2K3MGV1_TRIPR|nr:hypothetical protein L195_g046141 [Trifolium pratense]